MKYNLNEVIFFRITKFRKKLIFFPSEKEDFEPFIVKC